MEAMRSAGSKGRGGGSVGSQRGLEQAWEPNRPRPPRAHSKCADLTTQHSQPPYHTDAPLQCCGWPSNAASARASRAAPTSSTLWCCSAASSASVMSAQGDCKYWVLNSVTSSGCAVHCKDNPAAEQPSLLPTHKPCARPQSPPAGQRARAQTPASTSCPPYRRSEWW